MFETINSILRDLVNKYRYSSEYNRKFREISRIAYNNYLTVYNFMQERQTCEVCLNCIERNNDIFENYLSVYSSDSITGIPSPNDLRYIQEKLFTDYNSVYCSKHFICLFLTMYYNRYNCFFVNEHDFNTAINFFISNQYSITNIIKKSVYPNYYKYYEKFDYYSNIYTIDSVYNLADHIQIINDINSKNIIPKEITYFEGIKMFEQFLLPFRNLTLFNTNMYKLNNKEYHNTYPRRLPDNYSNESIDSQINNDKYTGITNSNIDPTNNKYKYVYSFYINQSNIYSKIYDYQSNNTKLDNYYEQDETSVNFLYNLTLYFHDVIDMILSDNYIKTL